MRVLKDGEFFTEWDTGLADLLAFIKSNNPDSDVTLDQLSYDADEQSALLQGRFEEAVQTHLDTTAKAHSYDSIMTAVSYAEEPAVPKFQQDGQAFRAWRSLVWAYCYQALADVKAGNRATPALSDFIAELPSLSLEVSQ